MAGRFVGTGVQAGNPQRSHVVVSYFCPANQRMFDCKSRMSTLQLAEAFTPPSAPFPATPLASIPHPTPTLTWPGTIVALLPSFLTSTHFAPLCR
jgi:hypothetical protein